MTKSAIILGVTGAIIIAAYFLFQNQEVQAPIVDPKCEPGYELVGEGCIPAKDACELQGDQYHYHESTEECHPHTE